MTASDIVGRLHHELGVVGLASIAVLASAVLFLVVMLKPLEARNADLERQLALNTRENATTDAALLRASTPSAKMAAFYHFLASGRQTTDWLDRLYAVGKDAGVELQSAEYRMQDTGTRIDRYEVRVPLRGNYAQIRTFLNNALVEIPVLSLDEVRFKREHASDAQVEAEVHLTFHLVKSVTP
ncbi:MAG TPA: GspMb/PilO family protein [Burkholderiales bacterium]|nr:GspMb/PilO family protein [Burkholderiales bacterium]